jgi:hypothetical protein
MRRGMQVHTRWKLLIHCDWSHWKTPSVQALPAPSFPVRKQSCGWETETVHGLIGKALWNPNIIWKHFSCIKVQIKVLHHMTKVKAPERYLHAAKPQLCQMNEVLTFASTFSIWKGPFRNLIKALQRINQQPHVSHAPQGQVHERFHQPRRSQMSSQMLTMNELTKACECVPRTGIPNLRPASTLLQQWPPTMRQTLLCSKH